MWHPSVPRCEYVKIFRALFFTEEKYIIFIAHSWAIVQEELNLFVPDFKILNLYKNIRSQANFNACKAEFYEFTERWEKCDVPSWPLFHRKNDLVTKAEQEGLDWLCFPFCFSQKQSHWTDFMFFNLNYSHFELMGSQYFLHWVYSWIQTLFPHP